MTAGSLPASLAGGSRFTPGSDERAAVARHREGMTTATKIPAAWAAAHAPAAGVPRWARVAAYAVPLTVLPSSAWRIAACTFHAPIVRGDVVSDVTSSGVPGVPLWLYVILLSIASELLAFTAVGLVSTWGEVFPRWIPGLRGRFRRTPWALPSRSRPDHPTSCAPYRARPYCGLAPCA